MAEVSLTEAINLARRVHCNHDHQKAEEIYRSILEVYPDHPQINHNLGVLLFENGYFLDAKSYFIKAIEKNPNVSQYWISLLKTTIILGDLVEVNLQFNRAEKCGLDINHLRSLRAYFENNLNASDPDIGILRQLNEYYVVENFKALLRFGESLRQLYPKSAKVLNLLGAAYLRLGSFSEAENKLIEAIKLETKFTEAYNNLGIAYQNKGDSKSAQEMFEVVISLNPLNAQARNSLALTYYYLDEFEPAIENYLGAIELSPEYPEAYYNLGNVYNRLGKISEAVQNYEKAIEIKPDYAEAYNNLGILHKNMSNYAVALDYFKLANKHGFQTEQYFVNVGSLFHDIGDTSSALKNYTLAISKGYTSHVLYNNLAVSYFQSGDAKKAWFAIQEAVRLKCDYTKAYVNGAEILEKTNRLEDLEEWLVQAKRNIPDFVGQINLFFAKLHFRKGEFAEAQKKLQAIKLDTLDVINRSIFYGLSGQCADQLSQYDLAFEFFNKMNNCVLNNAPVELVSGNAYLKNKIDFAKRLSGYRYADKRRVFEKNPDMPELYFLIGFPRSGTTLLDTILRSHSNIAVMEEKPIFRSALSLVKDVDKYDFISRFPSEEERTIVQKKYMEELRKFVKPSLEVSRFVDKLPLNILWIPHIQFFFPNAKFIIAIRHPMDCILSNWMQNFQLNPAMENMLTLENIVKYYDISMEIFFESDRLFGLDFCISKYEDLVNDFRSQTAVLMKFLKCDWEENLLDYQKTARDRELISTPSYSQVIKPIYNSSIGRWKNYEKYLSSYMNTVEPWVKKFGYSQNG